MIQSRSVSLRLKRSDVFERMAAVGSSFEMEMQRWIGGWVAVVYD